MKIRIQKCEMWPLPACESSFGSILASESDPHDSERKKMLQLLRSWFRQAGKCGENTWSKMASKHYVCAIEEHTLAQSFGFITTTSVLTTFEWDETDKI